MNRIYILFILSIFFQLGSFQTQCSKDVTCITGKCCGPYEVWAEDYTCCPSMSICGSTVCVSYWVIIVPCVCGGIAIILVVIAIILQKKRRLRRLQQQQLLQQNPQPQINQPQVYYVPQPQPGYQPYQQGQPGFNVNQPYQPGQNFGQPQQAYQ